MTDLFLEHAALNPIFYTVFDRIAPAADKYMAMLFNTSASNVLMVERILKFNWHITPVITAVNQEQYIARITAFAGGATVTIRSADILNAIPVGADARSGVTPVTEAHIIRRFMYGQDEVMAPGNVPEIPAYPAYMLGGEEGNVIWSRRPQTKGLILRQNEGVAIRNVTASTNGTCSYVIEFMQVYP